MKILLIIFSFSLIILYGCIEEPSAPSGSISGTVYDDYGIPVSYALVSLSEYPIVGTDIQGNFNIETQKFPYDISVTYLRESHCTKYLGVSLPSSKIYAIDNFSFAPPVQVNVTFPNPAYNARSYIKFVSTELFNQFEYTFFLKNSAELKIYIPRDKNQISGKLIYLEVYTWPETDYIKYGIKDVTLNKNTPNNIVFTEQDVSYDPPEVYSSFIVNLPPNYTSYDTFAEINFPGMSVNSSFQVDGFGKFIGGNFRLPVIRNVNFNFKITNKASSPSTQYHWSYISKKWGYINPGEGIQINQEDNLKLILPQNDTENITDTSTFAISDDEIPGVYIYRIIKEISPSSMRIIVNVVSDKKSIKFGEFKARGVSFEPGETYRWVVQKYPNYTSIDDFASVKYNEDSRYSGIAASNFFSFKTAP